MTSLKTPKLQGSLLAPESREPGLAVPLLVSVHTYTCFAVPGFSVAGSASSPFSN